MSIRIVSRPVFVWVTWIILVAAGVASIFSIAIIEEPLVESNVIKITTSNSASPEMNEKRIVAPLEQSIISIPGLRLAVTTIGGYSASTTLEFVRQANMFESQIKVRDAIMNAKNDMPSECRYPSIVSGMQDELSNVFTIYFFSDKMSNEHVFQHIEKHFKHEMESIPGVASVAVVGADKESVILEVLPDRLLSNNVDFTTFLDALGKVNFRGGSTNLQVGNKELSLNVDYEADSESKLDLISVRNRDDKQIPISELVRVTRRYRGDASSRSRVNSKKVVMVRFFKKPQGNVLKICEEIRFYFEKLLVSLAKLGIEAQVEKDVSVFINKGIVGVYKAIVEAFILVAIVIIIFFRSFKLTLIATVAIPFSIIPAFLLMHVLDCTINIFSLFAFLLAIGIVGDDCMVFIENVQKHVEQGKPVRPSVVQSIREMFAPIVSMTIVMICVFVPIFFISDPEIIKFKDFAVTLSASIVVSGFFSLTLSPVMFYYMYPAEKPSWSERRDRRGQHAEVLEEHKSTGVFGWVEESYRRVLSFFLSRRQFILAVTSPFMVFAIGFLLVYMPKENNIAVDRNKLNYFTLNTTNYSNEYVEGCMLDFVAKVRSSPIGVDIIGDSTVCDKREGLNGVTFTLRDKTERKHTRTKIIAAINAIETELPTDISFVEDHTGNARKTFRATMQVYGGTMKDLEESIVELYEKFGKRFMYDSISKKECFKIDVDVKACGRYGIDPSHIIRCITAFRKDLYLTTLDERGDSLTVHVEIPETKAEKVLEELTNIPVMGYKEHKATIIPITNVVHVVKKPEYSNIVHINGTKGVNVTFILDENENAEDFLKQIDVMNESLAENIVLKPHPREVEKIKFDIVMRYLVLLAVGLIYLVMAAQFESFLDPIIILFCVPGSLLGALILMLHKGCKLNSISTISMITLFGLIAKHGILIVEFANKIIRRRAAKNSFEAVAMASKMRLRPIFMTTVCMILGAIPLYRSTSEFSEYKVQVGACIIGGMLIGTVISLFFVPMVYLVLKGEQELRVDDVKPDAGDGTHPSGTLEAKEMHASSPKHLRHNKKAS